VSHALRRKGGGFAHRQGRCAQYGQHATIERTNRKKKKTKKGEGGEHCGKEREEERKREIEHPRRHPTRY